MKEFYLNKETFEVDTIHDNGHEERLNLRFGGDLVRVLSEYTEYLNCSDWDFLRKHF